VLKLLLLLLLLRLVVWGNNRARQVSRPPELQAYCGFLLPKERLASARLFTARHEQKVRRQETNSSP
jgi:hypothetical protein